MHYQDPLPKRISYTEWNKLFQKIPQTVIDQCRYYREYGDVDWSVYLSPPSTFAIYGNRYLKKLTYDNSLASLRLWGFILNESERLYRARQMGKTIIATMGDLGGITPLIYAFPNTIAFYPDCLWWTPFLMESEILFDAAEELGLGEDCCYSRAALGAFRKQAYFPKPDLCIAATGASCDDYSAVQQLVEWLGHKVHWLEIPQRKDPLPWYHHEEFVNGNEATLTYQKSALEYLRQEYELVQRKIEEITGQKLCLDSLRKTIRKVNRIRRLITRIKHLTYTAAKAPLPALELMNAEFMALHYYSDLEESILILEHLLEMVQQRVQTNDGLLSEDAVRIAWVTPPADVRLLNFLEDLGGRVVGTEYVIAQALTSIDETKEPLTALAESFIQGSLLGSSTSRAERVIQQAKTYHADGVIISGIFGGSHCPVETRIIKERVTQRLGLPVLTFDVPPPRDKMLGQVRTRMEAFIEGIKGRK